MSEFNYLIDKIKEAVFTNEPFEHIIIDDFLSKEHFEEFTKLSQINFPEFENHKGLVDYLLENGYHPQKFPGCITDTKKYLKYLESGDWPVDKNLLMGFGMTFRINEFKDSLLKELNNFLVSDEFKTCLENKFKITESNYIDTGIQKYLQGYEISPHPDIRKKAVTYMLNINPGENSEKANIHTYLMKFKPEREYVYNFWKENKSIDRCWVPWDWCDEVTKTTKNNSIILFSPSDYSLHAIKLDYNHLKFQRTQLYGNLWYDSDNAKYDRNYQNIDLLSSVGLEEKKKSNNFKKLFSNDIKDKVKGFLK